MTFPLLILSPFCYLEKTSTKSNYQLPEGPPLAPDRRMKGFLQHVNSSFFLNVSLTLLGGQSASGWPAPNLALTDPLKNAGEVHSSGICRGTGPDLH